MFSVCLRMLGLYLCTLLEIHTHFYFVISKHTDLKKYQSIHSGSSSNTLLSEQIPASSILYVMQENRVAVMAPPDLKLFFFEAH